MKKKAKTVLGLCLLLLLGPPTMSTGAEAQSSAEQIEELLELTGAGDLGVQVMHGMIEPMKQALPEVPAEWWDGFMAKVDPDEINRLVIPIYEKIFTDREIAAMLTFYRTPEGQSIIGKMPSVMQESMVVGQEWGEKLAEEILRDLQADGYEVPPGLQS